MHSSVQEEVSVKELVCTEPWPQSHPTPLGGSEPHLICISNALVAEWKQISAGLRLCEKPETRRIEVVTAAENMQCLGLCMHACIVILLKPDKTSSMLVPIKQHFMIKQPPLTGHDDLLHLDSKRDPPRWSRWCSDALSGRNHTVYVTCWSPFFSKKGVCYCCAVVLLRSNAMLMEYNKFGDLEQFFFSAWSL